MVFTCFHMFSQFQKLAAHQLPPQVESVYRDQHLRRLVAVMHKDTDFAAAWQDPWEAAVVGHDSLIGRSKGAKQPACYCRVDGESTLLCGVAGNFLIRSDRLNMW